jgi:hypothetical protein
MPRGVAAYIATVVLASWGFGCLVLLIQHSLPENQKQMAALAFLPVAFVPLLTVWVLHRRQAAAGNPYMGLVWGPTGWYWLLFAGGLLWGGLVVLAQIALGAAGFDPQMGYYIEFSRQMAEKQAGQPMPAGQNGMFQIVGMVTAISSLVVGPWFGAAAGCMGSFPLLGWLGRRLLTRGRALTCVTLMALAAATSAVAGLIDNPQLEGVSPLMRSLLYAAYGIASIPAMLWVFYKTRSAVLPALLTASYASAMAGATPFLSDFEPWLSNPQSGLATSAGMLLLGIALWVWQDPGGQELAVAAVAQDGTPLSPAMLAQAQAYGAAGPPAS